MIKSSAIRVLALGSLLALTAIVPAYADLCDDCEAVGGCCDIYHNTCNACANAFPAPPAVTASRGSFRDFLLQGTTSPSKVEAPAITAHPAGHATPQRTLRQR